VALRHTVSLFAALFATFACIAPAHADAVQTRVANGTLAGTAADGIASYKGIPYAAPPVGDLRWRPPQPPAAWPGSLDASDYGHSCPQPDAPAFVHADSRAASTSEDCLTLNVWAPVAHAAPLPVMVFIHGGGNTAGTGSQRYYDGTAFAHDGVMLVTLNYRLGLLGFFAHPALSAEQRDAPRGNYGLLDQIAALEWVKTNAAAFGGDPTNVTVFGESAGGLDIEALATAPLAKGLFGRAIVESAGGVWLSWAALPQAEQHGVADATKFGLSGAHATAAQLRSIPAATLAASDDEEAGDLIVDGRLLPQSPLSAIERGLSLPMIVGVNDDEGSLNGDGDPDQIFPHIGGPDMAALRKSFAGEGITEKPAVASRLVGDGYFAAPARWVAAHDSAAYLYRFDYIMYILQSRRSGAQHGSEIPFVFESWSTSRLVDADRQVGATLHACWIAFARTGTPACPSSPAWPLYTRSADKQMVFGTDATASVQPVRDAPEFDILERDLAKP
jgi:para-nitrobenzyl esterase